MMNRKTGTYRCKYVSTLLHAAAFLWGALLLFCTVSCTDEYDQLPSGALPVAFSTDIWSSPDEASTRVIDTKWTGNEKVGVYMLGPGTSSVPNGGAYSIYSPTGNVGGTDVSLSTSGSKFYYPVNGDKVNFVAFSPFDKQPTNNLVSYTMTTTSSSQAAMEAMDLIYCKTTAGYRYDSGDNKDGAIKLSFGHQFSKIEVTVHRDASLGSVSLEDKLSLSLNNIPNSVTFDLNEGEITSTATPSALNSVTFYKDAAKSTAAKAVFMAIVAPHTNVGTLTFDGVGISPAHTYKLNQTYAMNTRYQYEFTLAQQGVVLTDTQIDNWTGGTIAWNDDYTIQVEGAVTSPKFGGTGVLLFTTNCPKDKGIVVRKSSKATGAPDNKVSWITLTNDGDNLSPYATNKYAQEYTVIDINFTGAPRVGYLHITAGTLTAVVKVTQDIVSAPRQSEANCYILPPGGHKIEIPVSIIKTFNSSIATLNGENKIPIVEGGALNAFIVWSDVARDGASTGSAVPQTDVIHYGSAVSRLGVNGTGTNAYVYIVSGAKTGNAVVAVTNSGSDQILWSWHIWVTDFNPTTTARTYTSTGSPSYTTTFMDRNLGATSATPGADGSLGLLYQWGRKDPFTGGTSPNDDSERKIYMRTTASAAFTYTEPVAFDSFKSNSGQVYINESLKHPYTFYSWFSSQDWSITGQETANGITCRWLNANGKAIDDPCPAGWKVSISGGTFIDNSIWGGLTTSNFALHATFKKGRAHERLGWWPFSGYRSSYGGSFMGGTGVYYTASAGYESYYGVFLNLSNVSLSFQSNGRPFAQGIRCSLE